MDQTVQAMLGMAATGLLLFAIHMFREWRWARADRANRAKSEAAAEPKK